MEELSAAVLLAAARGVAVVQAGTRGMRAWWWSLHHRIQVEDVVLVWLTASSVLPLYMFLGTVESFGTTGVQAHEILMVFGVVLQYAWKWFKHL